MIIAGVAGGPNWTDIMTAFGTVGAVVVAVGIALWSEYRSGKRIKEERARSDQVLADQRDQDKAAIEDERAHGHMQLEEERQITRDREQLAQAYLVQVVLADRPEDIIVKGDDSEHIKRLAAIVVNRGAYTITRIEAQFCLGRSMNPHHGCRRLTGRASLPDALWDKYRPLDGPALSGVLTPFDLGIRFETDKIHDRHLASPYPVVRWTDDWGTRWEHKRGVVRQVRDDDPWEP